MAMSDVCRLCLATDNLVYIFNEESMRLNMKDIISLSTGIEIHTKDIISQKVCEKCYQFSIQIFQFRGQCLKADKYLKSLCMDYLVDKKYYIPNTEVTIKGVTKNEEERKPDPIFTKQLSKYEVHPSIIKLSHVYPKMKLPRFCISFNVTPIVEMEMDHVENYFKRLNLDFNICVKNALSVHSPLLALSKEITITRIDQPDRGLQNGDNVEICETPVRNHLRNPFLSNIRRKLLENSSKENVQKTKGDIETGRKRKHSTADSERQNPFDVLFKKRMRGERIIFRDADTTCSNLGSNNPSKKRRKLSLTESVSNERTDDVKPMPLKIPHRINQIIDRYIEINSREEPTIHEIPSDVIINESGNNTNRQPHSGSSFRENHLNENEDCESLTSVDRSVRLFVCEICSSVQYTMFDLRKHMSKHMRCQFCKIRFRTMQSKIHHIDNSCIIRKMMNDLPHVELIKVEYCKQARRRYPEAFIGFPPLPHTDQSEAIAVLSDDLDEPFFRGFPRDKEIIEILSDPEDMPFPPTPKKEHPPIVPDIRSNAFAKLGSQTADKGVLKNILTMLQPTPKDFETQTDLPGDGDVTVAENFRALLKNLMPFMSSYNILVRLQPGEFNVTYDYNLKSASDKKMCLWNDLIPVDVKSDPEDC